MQLDKTLCEKFPVILKNKLLNKEIELPDSTKVEYTNILTYRAVERKSDDNHEITREDFKSYFELGKKPRGFSGNLMKKPEYYGVSSFLKKETVEQTMKFPNPNKKMACGFVYSEGGPQDTNEETQHVCWWLYEDVDLSGFKLI